MKPDRHSSSASDVRDLFNQKARTWEHKYASNGPLRPRLTRFADCIDRDVQPGGRILDLGCGTGSLARHLAAMGYLVTACDIADKMIDEAVRTCQSTAIAWRLLQPFWSRLPFESDTFDAIVASSVFEYVHSVDDALAECRRTLKPGGCVIFTAPNPQHHVRKLEFLFRPAAVGALRLRLVELVPKLTGYLSYLKSSRNRMSAAEWEQAASRCGLIAAENWVEADSALMLIRVAKPFDT